MANEIAVDYRLKVAKGYLKHEERVTNQLLTMSGDALDAKVQSIPTAATGTALTFTPAIGTPGHTFFRNLDANNYVEIGYSDATNFQAIIKLKATECALCRLASTSVWAKANTGAVLLKYACLED